jgi:hypothetical protein
MASSVGSLLHELRRLAAESGASAAVPDPVPPPNPPPSAVAPPPPPPASLSVRDHGIHIKTAGERDQQPATAPAASSSSSSSPAPFKLYALAGGVCVILICGGAFVLWYRSRRAHSRVTAPFPPHASRQPPRASHQQQPHPSSPPPQAFPTGAPGRRHVHFAEDVQERIIDAGRTTGLQGESEDDEEGGGGLRHKPKVTIDRSQVLQ